MSCVMVIWLDQPFSEFDERYGFTKAAEMRMRAAPSQDIVVLVLRGIDNITPDEHARLRNLKTRFVDASSALADVRAEYSFAKDASLWRGNNFLEMTFLRFLVIERVFGDTPILTADVDIIWRVDPYALMEKWKRGGSFLFDGSCCIVFIKGRSWYDSFRDGAAQLAADPTFGASHKTRDFSGIYHEQALCQFLIKNGMMENDAANIRGHEGFDQYAFSVHTLNAFHDQPRPLSFAKKDGLEYVNGKLVPLWHMQSRFSRYLFTALFMETLGGLEKFRVPYEPRNSQSDLAAILIAKLHFEMLKGRIDFNARLAGVRQYLDRTSQYEEFFDRGLAENIFTDARWWQPGVWADVEAPPRLRSAPKPQAEVKAAPGPLGGAISKIRKRLLPAQRGVSKSKSGAGQ